MRNRWKARGAMILLLAAAGVADAQVSPTPRNVQPAPAPTADQPIVRMRTAGQPDRQLKVLRVTKYPDGESVAEVQDVQTNQIFTLPGKVVAMLPKEAVTLPQPSATPPLVQAPRPTPPVVQPQPSPPVAKPAPQPEPEPKVTFLPPEPAPEPKLVPIVEPKVEPAPQSTVGPVATSGASLVWRPRSTEAKPLAPTPVVPTPVEPAKPDRWTPLKKSLQSLAPASQTIVRGTYHTVGEDDEPPAVRVIRPRVVEERNPVVLVEYRTLDMQIRDETQGYVYELASALRPSVRENAAICLAEGRYGWRQEVKTVLAKAAVVDPAPSVRAKCIELLMQLGYHDPNYMAYLQSASVPGQVPTLVRAAAKDALAKLAPRN